MKKLLFVGDLRTGGNYGAVATTQCLLDMLYENFSDFEISTIEGRSFHKQTPINGWSDTEKLIDYYVDAHDEKRKLKATLRRKAIKIIGMLRGDKNSTKSVDSLPRKFKEFDYYKEKVKSGEIFAYEARMIEQSDIIVINSEGAIVNGTGPDGVYRRGGRYVLFFAYIAKVLFSKKVCIINHTVDPKNQDVIEMIRNIYPLLDLIVVRDGMALSTLRSLDICEAVYLPDALFSYKTEDEGFKIPSSIRPDFDFSKPFVCLGDSTGFINSFQKVKWNVEKVYSRLVDELIAKYGQVLIVDGFNGNNDSINKLIKKKKLSFVRLGTCTFKTLYQIFKKSSIYISGRWHTSILALCAHTPIICWGADSNKTLSLYKDINYPFVFFDINTIPININEIVEESQKVLDSDLSKYWVYVDRMSEESKRIVELVRTIADKL